jgi:hypothetical protein
MRSLPAVMPRPSLREDTSSCVIMLFGVLFVLLLVNESSGFLFFKPAKGNYYPNQQQGYDPFEFHHQKQTDYYGEYSLRSGRKVYTYCFDVRFEIRDQCQPISWSSWQDSYRPNWSDSTTQRPRHDYYTPSGTTTERPVEDLHHHNVQYHHHHDHHYHHFHQQKDSNKVS